MNAVASGESVNLYVIWGYFIYILELMWKKNSRATSVMLQAAYAVLILEMLTECQYNTSSNGAELSPVNFSFSDKLLKNANSQHLANDHKPPFDNQSRVSECRIQV